MSDRNELICICMDIRRGVIEDAIKQKNLTTFEGVQDTTEAGTSCGGCANEIEGILKELNPQTW